MLCVCTEAASHAQVARLTFYGSEVVRPLPATADAAPLSFGSQKLPRSPEPAPAPEEPAAPSEADILRDSLKASRRSKA